MAPITANFTSEAPLSAAVREAISGALEHGWADPKKISQSAATASLLQAASIEELADLIGASASQIEIVGEPNLLAYLSLSGFLHDLPHLATTSVDVGKVRAVARSYSGPKSTVEVTANGDIDFSQVASGSVISVQSVNGETGARVLDGIDADDATIIVDATSDAPLYLPDFASAATFNARSWGGPSGIGFLVIRSADRYRYPLPHIAPIRTPGSYSLPLLIGSVIAATEYVKSASSISGHRAHLRNALGGISGLQIVESMNSHNSAHISLLIEGVSNQEFISRCERNGLSLDAGSACSPEDIAPSHVIAAMGLPTQGHIRLTLRASHTTEEIDFCGEVMKRSLQEL